MEYMRISLIIAQWVFYIGLLFSSWWYIALPLAIWLTLSYGLTLPVLTAVLIDGYFNAFANIPYLTLTVLGCGVCVLLLRPYFFMSRNT